VKVKLASLTAPGRGATVLEGLGFMVDAVAKKLITRDLLAL